MGLGLGLGLGAVGKVGSTGAGGSSSAAFFAHELNDRKAADDSNMLKLAVFITHPEFFQEMRPIFLLLKHIFENFASTSDCHKHNRVNTCERMTEIDHDRSY